MKQQVKEVKKNKKPVDENAVTAEEHAYRIQKIVHARPLKQLLYLMGKTGVKKKKRNLSNQ